MSKIVATEEEIRLHNECDKPWLEYVLNPTQDNREAFDKADDDYKACYDKRSWNMPKGVVRA